MDTIGYNESNVAVRLGLSDINDLQMRALPIYRKENLYRREEVDLAIDLFLLQGELTSSELYRLLSEKEQQLLKQAEVLSVDENGSGRATVSLYPSGNRLFFSDHAWPQLSQAPGTAVPWGQVMFVGTDSRWLARSTIRTPVANALDLCTGSGIHALLAATHVKQAVAVDINPRAAQCTLFNALASGCKNLEVKTGDLYDPVGDEKFDLITANPPFVPSPVNTLAYRDGGPSGEDVQRRIVAGLQKHLAPGGVAQIITEVGESNEISVADRVRGWLRDAPINLHVLKFRIFPAAVYAIGHGAGDNFNELLESVDDWASNLRQQGYSRVVAVLLTFQWSDSVNGSPWNRTDEAYPPRDNCGDIISKIFDIENKISSHRFQAELESKKFSRIAPVILNENRVLGGNLTQVSKGFLSKQPLSVEYSLDPIELDLLAALEQTVDYTTLLSVASNIGLSVSVLKNSLMSLYRKRLIEAQ
ncbi:MAG: methyltransferase [Fibrobacteres bacterium]|nr:methyltransferase [Fibrobacterota bacterium]